MTNQQETAERGPHWEFGEKDEIEFVVWFIKLRDRANKEEFYFMVTFASKLSFGIQPADWQERINLARMREQRAEKARQVMRKHGIAALLASRGENVRYLTGLRGPEFLPQLYYVLFFAEDDPVAFAGPGWITQIPPQAPWIKHWRMARSWLTGIAGHEATLEESRKFASEIYEDLRERGLTKEKLAVAGFDGTAQRALGELGLTLTDGWPLMLEARTTKTDDEINCLKTVAAICEAAWYRVWESLRVGIRDTDLSLIIANALHEAGADRPTAVQARSGPLCFERGPSATGRLIQTGDLVYATMCHVPFLSYHSCTYRTFIVGRKPNAREKDWYKVMLERMDAIIDAIKPGATTADAAKHFAPASTWGYKDEHAVLTIEIGHGIGIGGYDMPVINRQWSLDHPQVFEPGMTIAVESREGEHGAGGVRLENMLVVTEKGAEIMDYFPRDEILMAPY